ncbi:MAG: hypothetical protein R3C44_05530 [Chloroflexota bacterium]
MREAYIKAEHLHRQSDEDARLTFALDPVVRRYIQPALIAIMASAFATSLLVVIKIVTPECHGTG